MQPTSDEEQDERDAILFERYGGCLGLDYIPPFLIVAVGWWDECRGGVWTVTGGWNVVN